MPVVELMLTEIFTINSGNLIASGIKTSFSGIVTRSDAYLGFSGTTDPNDPLMQ